MHRVKYIKKIISSDKYIRRDVKALEKYCKGKFVSVLNHNAMREEVRYENINLKTETSFTFQVPYVF